MRSIASEAIKGNSCIREFIDMEVHDQLYATGAGEKTLPMVKPGDAMQIQYTSGTTGFPKGTVLSHRDYSTTRASTPGVLESPKTAAAQTSCRYSIPVAVAWRFWVACKPVPYVAGKTVRAQCCGEAV